MTKKNLRPQQVAPVQRETTAAKVEGEVCMPSIWKNGRPIELETDWVFAGDDAE